MSEPHLQFETTRWWYWATLNLTVAQGTQHVVWEVQLNVSSLHPGMKTLLKKYELPKAEEVNVYKQKLERIHAEFATSSKWVDVARSFFIFTLRHLNLDYRSKMKYVFVRVELVYA